MDWMTRLQNLSPGEDAGPWLRLALAELPDGGTLRLPQGTYHIDALSCPEYDLAPSNNRNGRKRVALPLVGRQGLTIEGGGARLIFHGGVLPVWLRDCRDITLRHFSIDWERPFYSQGVITGFDASGVEFEVDLERYPCRVEAGRMLFEGEGWAHPLTEGIFEIDARTGAPAWHSGDNLGTRVRAGELPAVDLGGGRFRLEHPFRHRPRMGNYLVLRHFKRHYPGIFMEKCRDLRIEGVTLHHCAGTGFLGQFCENILLDRAVVEPTPGSGRCFAVTVDAAHFVNCRGLIHQRGCRFARTMDDPTNVHGINSRVASVEDARTAVLERVHHEQRGLDLGFPGDRVQFCCRHSLLPVGQAVIESAEAIDESFARVRFAEPLPEGLASGMVMENLSWTPDVHIEGCSIGPNRARGYLISTPGRVLIENCRITAAGAGVKISGDANYWFESGAVRDVTIRNNTFTDLCYGPPEWGTAAIDIDPEIPDPWAAGRCFHRNIRILGNTFRVFDHGLLYARSVEGIEFSGNRVEWTSTHPPSAYVPCLLNFDACRRIVVRDNAIPPREEGVPEQVVNDDAPGCHRWTPQSSLDLPDAVSDTTGTEEESKLSPTAATD